LSMIISSSMVMRSASELVSPLRRVLKGTVEDAYTHPKNLLH
jgi:hypothetical protein